MRFLVLAALLLGLVHVPRIALAADQDEALARAHFVLGQKLYESERYDQALIEFEQGRKTKHLAAFDYNIGMCHEHLGQLQQAIDAFTAYRAATVGQDAAEADQRIAGLQRRLDAQKAAAAAPTVVTPPVAVEVAAPLPPPPPPHRRRAWIWGVAGGAVVVAAGAVALGLALGLPNNAPAQRGTDPTATVRF